MTGKKKPKGISPEDKIVNVVKLFKNTKGKFARQPFNLQPWQEEILRKMFRVGPDGLRVVREAFIFLPRKNGKTELAAAIALYCLLFDGEIGGEHYIAATDKDQASIAYAACAAMVKADKNLLKRCKVLDATKTIVVHSTGSFLKAIPADAGGSDGYGAATVIYDELHAAPNRDLYEVLRQSQGGREQPLFISITTAGFDKKSICYERYQYACKVRDGLVIDPAFLPVIYEAPDKADWRDEKVWVAANPGLQGKTPFRNLGEMRRFAKEAELIVGMQNTFRMKYLNQWTEQDVRWIAGHAWEKCRGEQDPLEGRKCWAALDLSSTTDLSALVYVFEPVEEGGRIDILCRFYCPGEGARQRAEKDRVPYLQWIEQGHITATPGDVVDYDRIKLDIEEDAERFQIVSIAVDRWNATHLITQLGSAGFDVIPFGQGMYSMAGPSKRFEELVIGATYRHDGNPVLAWCIANVAAESDAAGNKKPSKKKSPERIDGVVALIMATGIQAAAKEEEGGSGEVIFLDDE